MTPFPVLTSRDDYDSVVEFPPLGPSTAVLMVWPKFPTSFLGMEGATKILPEKTHMPPLALITIAALFPRAWKVRLIDCAFEDLKDRVTSP